MNSLAVIDKSRPEECLARLQSRNPHFLADLTSRLYARVNMDFTWYSPVERIQQALEENRRNLEALPDQDELEQLVEAVEKALSICSEKGARRHVARLIGAFPNASLTDPETYIAALVFDVMDCQIPDAILLLTCQQIRRTSRFVPTISEVIGTAQHYLSQWQQVLASTESLHRTRENLAYATQSAYRTLEHVRAHGHKPPMKDPT
ncbi:MAG: hypothetical protein U1E16_03970 [Hyphomicrobiales bacterium]